MQVLGVILARAGSKGLPDKCVRELLGRAVIEYTFDHALASLRLSAVVFTSDSEPAKAIARARGIEVIDRPAELATDTATVDAVARHAVEEWERRRVETTPLDPPLVRGEARHWSPSAPLGKGGGAPLPDGRGSDAPMTSSDATPLPDGRGSDWRAVPVLPADWRAVPTLRARGSDRQRVDVVVLIYGNIPVRGEGLIDRAIGHLVRTGADSVRSVAPVTKQHPDWVHRLDGDRMVQFRPNSIYRRQDLEPLYYHDGAVAVVTREALFGALATPDDHQSFLGRDRRAIVCHSEDAVDIDGPVDLCLAEAILGMRATEPRSHEATEGKVEKSKRRKVKIGGTETRRHEGTKRGHASTSNQNRDRQGAELPGDKATEPRRHEGTKKGHEDRDNQNRDREGAELDGNGGTKPRRHEGTEATYPSRDREGAVCRLSIGGRRIGTGEPVFVIAEAGVNHNGDVEAALRMVDAAAKTGADAVKFQMFRAADLTTTTAPMAHYQLSSHEAAPQRPSTLPSPPMGKRGIVTRSKPTSQREMLSRLELSFDDFARIKHRCDERGILFLATPFGLSEVEQLVVLNAPAIKIASTDLTNEDLLSAAVATGLPLIVSTGAATASEMESSVKFMAQCGAGDRLVLLHCVSRYPTPTGAINLRAIGAMGKAFGVPVGLSDHTTSTTTGGLAVAAGACLLEKHFTLDRRAAGPDHAMSLTPDELAVYVAAAREAQSMLGDGAIGMHADEQEVREIARRSVVAAVPIASGTRIDRSMLTAKRPGTGIPASRIDELVGRMAIADLAADALLSWDVVR